MNIPYCNSTSQLIYSEWQENQNLNPPFDIMTFSKIDRLGLCDTNESTSWDRIILSL